MRKLTTIFALAILFSAVAAFGQERPFRIGLKFGYPQLAGLNLEYVTPALNERLSADVDLSYFGLTSGDASVSYTFLYFGANYYFFNEGEGLYGGLGYGRQAFGADVTITDNANSGLTAQGEASIGLNSLYLKIGGKHGGLFYFKWNVGYGIALTDGKLEASATFNGVKQVEEVDLPISGGGPMVDLGFGFSF